MSGRLSSTIAARRSLSPRRGWVAGIEDLGSGHDEAELQVLAAGQPKIPRNPEPCTEENDAVIEQRGPYS